MSDPGQVPAAEATPPPVPAAVAVQTPDWYPDPQNPAEDRYFDGAVWTPLTRQRGVQPPVCGPSIRDDSDEMPGTMLPMKPVVVFKAFLGLTFSLSFLVTVLALFAMSTPAYMSATTAGTVTSVRISSSSGARPEVRLLSKPSCLPVAEFLVGRETYRASMPARSWPCSWSAGQQVTIAYNPDHPSQAMILATGWTKYRLWILAGSCALGTGASLVPLVRFFVRRLRRA